MAPKPPFTPVRELVETVHGVEVRDPYRWLEDAGSDEVRQWVSGQRAHTRRVLDGYLGRDRLERRLREAFAGGQLGPSMPRGEVRFFTRRAGSMDQAALYLEQGGVERLLLDPADLTGDPTAAIDWYQPSGGDVSLVAVGVSTGGGERSVIHLIRTTDGHLLDDRIPFCQWGSVEFEPGGQSFLYATFPEGEFYGQHLRRHRLGRPVADDELIFRPADHTDTIGVVSVSPDGRWTVVNVNRGWDESAIWLSDGGSFEPVFDGEAAIARAWFSGQRLLAHTNHGAPNWRLLEIDPLDPAPDHWLELIPESEHLLLEVGVSSDRLLIHNLVDAASWVSVHSLDGKFVGIVDLPPLATVTGLGADPSATLVFLTVETLNQPAFVLEVDPATGRFAARNGLQPPEGFDAAAHPVRQLRFRSADGTPSVIFLVGRGEGSGPTLLTGYGGFNLAKTPVWTPSVVPFLEAGGLYAVAVLRGGSEYGEAWHRAGMRESKQNVFDDFIAAAEAIISAGLATPASLGILGRSNGGLLVGAAFTQRPELFGAVVCQVPLLDMVRYERFRIAQLWSREYGSAGEPEAFRWLYAYSPYHRVSPDARYPPLLLLTGEDDARVDPSHAFKFAALMQGLHPESETLLRVEERAGHGAGKPLTKLVPEETDIWSFLLEHLR